MGWSYGGAPACNGWPVSIPDQTIMKQCRLCNSIRPDNNRCIVCRRKAQIKYMASEKGKASRKRYRASKAGKAWARRYETTEARRCAKRRYIKRYMASEKGEASMKRYMASEKGIAMCRAKRVTYSASQKGKVARHKYNVSEKGKARKREHRERMCAANAERQMAELRQRLVMEGLLEKSQ